MKMLNKIQSGYDTKAKVINGNMWYTVQPERHSSSRQILKVAPHSCAPQGYPSRAVQQEQVYRVKSQG